MSNALLLVRLFTREQVIEMYGIRPDIEEKFFEGCPVLYQSCGEDIYKESDIDEYVRHFDTPPYIYPSRRRGGKASASNDIAAFAAALREEGKSWKEVAKATNERHPPAPGQKKRTADCMRKLVERYLTAQLRTDGRVRVASTGSVSVQ